ncbi:MAG: DNA polymerase III subunit beta [Chitinophagales bacterium]|nr:MAG: DNA polymerase III subunit beta [Chitinophagales bacterium]
MKFVVSSGALLNHVQLINGVITSNPSPVVPILEFFLFDVKDSTLTLYATNLETSMITSLQIESKAKGRVAVPAKILLETLKNLGEQPLTFNIQEQTNTIEITSDYGKYRLAGEQGDDFPRIPEADSKATANIPSNMLAKAISKTIFAVGNDELRPAMTGVFFQLDKKEATFVGTDAHKLVRYKRTDISGEKAVSFIVPKKSLQQLRSILPSGSENVSITYTNSNAFFTFGTTTLICRLIEQKYPDYNAVIPRDNSSTLTINRLSFLSSLKRVIIFSNKTTTQIVLKMAGSELTVSAQDLDFSSEASEKLICSYEGPDLEIGFNGKFLIEMISALESDEVIFKLSGPSRAGVLLPAEKEDAEDLLMLVMPVMLVT